MDKYKAIIEKYGKSSLAFIQLHSVLLFVVVFASLTGYLVLQAGELTGREPSPTQIAEKKAEIKAIKIDEKSLKVVNELTTRNIDLESLFVERSNPFEN